MINPKAFIEYLDSVGFNFYTGVPDSVLEPFCSYLDFAKTRREHIIASNEGNAVALAAGNYLATEKLSIVYMQNSGFGNALNPLTSLTNEESYGIPMLVFIGWRGAPGVTDEPQHMLMGGILEQLLRLLNIRYVILSMDFEKAAQQIDEMKYIALSKMIPAAILVGKDTFEKTTDHKRKSNYSLSRELVVKTLLNKFCEDIIVSTTGKCSREVFEFLDLEKREHNNIFYCVGSMGHASSIALGIAKNYPNRRVVIFDGDGSLIMHMGALATIGCSKLKNLIHIVINNGCHESVGGQKTLGFEINISSIAKQCGYRRAIRIDSFQKLSDLSEDIFSVDGSNLIEILVNNNSRNDLLRPNIPLAKLKINFIHKLSESRNRIY